MGVFEEEVFGVRGKVLIKSEHELSTVAEKIFRKLFQVDFYLDSDMDLPHAETAMAEAMGFELWLSPIARSDGYTYELKMETGYCHTEVMNNRMHDFSPWLARYLQDIGEIETLAAESSTSSVASPDD